MIRVRREVGAGMVLWVLCACGASGPVLRRPEFAKPRGGVWNEAAPLVDGTDDEMMPAVGNTGWLVYASRQASNIDIYRRPVTGGAAERLTVHSAEDTDPAFSLDSQRIAYTSQSADVKGDIWIMDADGSDKRRLTDRSSADSAPAWSSSGKAIYFTSAPLGGPSRIERIDLQYGTRTLIVEKGWDPAPSADGQYLFYVALDERDQTRIFVLRFRDGAIAALTDGAYPEGFPTAHGKNVVFVRFTDDENRDGRTDGDDPASLWWLEFDPKVLDSEHHLKSTPLTDGSGSELFASSVGDWLVYTTFGASDLEIYALPENGMVAESATSDAILYAARSADDPTLRRFGLRYLIARAPQLEAQARYELGRDLAERGRYRDAVDEFRLAAQIFGEEPMSLVSKIEIERLRVLASLDGRWWAKNASQTQQVQDATQRISIFDTQDSRAALARLRGTLAEFAIALGERVRGVSELEQLSADTSAPGEDRARALDALADLYVRIGDPATMDRLCERLLKEHAAERFYAKRCANRWVRAAREPMGVPNRELDRTLNPLGLSVLASLEHVATRYADLPALAARARAELAYLQLEAGYPDASRNEWRRIAEDYPGERELQKEALLSLANSAEERKELATALESYEQLLARFSSDPSIRSQATRGIARISLFRARQEEADGDLKGALDDYRRLLRSTWDLTVAHRRAIYLSARLGRLASVVEEYRTRAERNPRDKLARYGLGYALTFEDDPDLGAAEREIAAALLLDPRFASGHLTLGWIRLQRERRSPREGWAERAVDSFDVVADLVDLDTEKALYAAARLNAGHALLALNKLDDAFLAYLDRELSGEEFDEPLTELIFRERFARVALREDHLDVALDQARIAHRLAGQLPGEPRKAAVSALLGGVYFLSEGYSRAVPWLEAAVFHYRTREDWDRAIPLLRTLSIAEDRDGRTELAQKHAFDLRALMAKGSVPSSPDRPRFQGLEFQIWTEIGAKADDVTLGPYGFSPDLERNIADALVARRLIRLGQYEVASPLLLSRVESLRAAVEKPLVGNRAIPEFLTALNEAALLAVKTGDAARSVAWWSEAVSVARAAKKWSIVVQLSESTLRVWARNLSPFESEAAEGIADALSDVIEKGDPEDSVAAARVLSLLDLHRVERGLGDGVRVEARGAVDRRFSGLLEALTRTASAANRAERLSRDYGFGDIRAVLPKAPYEDRSMETESATEEVTALTPEHAQNEKPPDNGPADLDAPVRAWRLDFERSELQGNDEALERAIDGFLSDPIPVDAPEHARFLRRAVEFLATRKPQAWRVLEHERLLRWQLTFQRIDAGGVPADWLRLRRLRGTPEYAPEQARTVVRALEGIPVTLDALRGVLGAHALLIQVFELGDRWLWVAIDADRIEFFGGDSGQWLAPSELKAWVPAREIKTIYVDGGDLVPSARNIGIDGDVELLEVVSASYLVASYEACHLPVGMGVRVGEGPDAPPSTDALRKQLAGASVVQFAAKPVAYGASVRAGAAQVVLEDAIGDERVFLDLDRLAGVFAPIGGSGQNATAQLALFEQVPAEPRIARLLAHAALLGGVPSVLTVSNGSPELGSVVAKSLQNHPMIRAVAGGLAGSALDGRLFGYRGMTLNDRIEFAFNGLLRSARAARPVYVAATQDPSNLALWTEANRHYAELLGYVDYLLVPSHRDLLARSSIKFGAQIAETLPVRKLTFEQQFATTYFRLGQIDQAAAVRASLIEGYTQAKQFEKARDEWLALGKILLQSGRHEQARAALTQCAELASSQKAELIEADCRSRLGSALRSLYLYDEARESYEAASALYRRNEHANQWAPARYLGFLYEGSLSDYESALAQFEFALAAVERFKSEESRASGLHLDIARVHRLRGEFELAAESLARARNALSNAEDPKKQRTEVLIETANLYWYRGRYGRARAAQAEALKLTLETGDTFRRIRVLSVGGLIAMNEGQLGEAEMLIRAALELSRLDGRKGEEAAQLNNLGVVLQRAGQLEPAVTAFRTALAIDDALGNREGRAFDLRNLGTALGRQRLHDQALKTLDEALSISRALGLAFNEVEALFRRGEVLEVVDRSLEAGQMYTQAADLALKISLPEVRWRALYALGRLEERRGQSRFARDYLDQALELVERLGRSQNDGGLEVSRDDLYEDAIRLASDANDRPGVFEIIERCRARQRLDAFSSRQIRFADKTAERLLQDYLRARDAVFKERRRAAQGHQPDQGTVEALIRKRDAIHRELVRTYPRIARAFTVSPTSQNKILRDLPKGTAVLSIFIGQRQSWAVVLVDGDSTLIPLALTRSELGPLVERIRKSMRAFSSLDTALADVSRLLLQPLRGALQGVKHLILIPDANLASVPMAALTLDGEALLDRMTISESSTASDLPGLLRSAPVRPKRVAAFAYGADLPFAQLEARAVSASPFLGMSATREVLEQSTMDAWDLAVHGRLDARDPLASRLEFAPSDRDDGHLDTSEVFGLRHVPKLVSLSGCETAGWGSGGSARLSLADAFLARGVHSVVATRDRVTDFSAARMMKWFYRKLRRLPTAQALREAMRIVRNQEPHPAHWATFTLVGDFR